MPRVVHFEIHVEDSDRAMKFYTELFDWKFNKWSGPMDYWLITTGEDDTPGINGGMVKRMSPIDGQAVIAYVCTVDVDNIDTYIEKSEKLGATVVVPKMPIPGMGWLCYAKDTEGNIFGIAQMDGSA